MPQGRPPLFDSQFYGEAERIRGFAEGLRCGGIAIRTGKKPRGTAIFLGKCDDHQLTPAKERA